MFISLIIILILSFAGFALTYLFANDETFLWRLSAGNIIGSAVFGFVCFIAANLFGLNIAVIIGTFLISLAPLILFSRRDYKQKFKLDYFRAKGKMQGASYKQFLKISFYLFFLVVFWQFFERAMFETAQGIFTGGSNNYGDLPYHLGAIFSFSDGANFPPQNPSYAGAKFTYPFMADFLTACLYKLGANVSGAMLVQNIAWAFSLLVVLERFVFKFTNSRLAGKIAPFLLFFSGGLGFLWFFKDYWQGAQSFLDFLWNLPRDYTIDSEKFRWGNSLVVLFITQRSLLFGMPLAIIVIQKLWDLFASEDVPEVVEIDKNSLASFPFQPFVIGLFAGFLPLIHLHSLAALFVVGVFMLFIKPEKWRDWTAFAIGVAIFSIGEIAFVMTGSATQTTAFFGAHFGWHKQQLNFFWFYLINTGLVFPALIAGLLIAYLTPKREIEDEETLRKKTKTQIKKDSKHSAIGTQHLLFFIPFAFLFVISNTMKLAPWEWDNIKVLIYWFIGSIPFIAYFLAWLWEKEKIFKLISAAILICLTFSGALDVWRTMSGKINSQVFPSDAIKIAEMIKKQTPPDALFLNDPTFKSAVALSGRLSLMRYTGHLQSHGIDFADRENDVHKIYAGDATADLLLKKYNVDYVLISPDERDDKNLMLNETYFQKFPKIAESGQFAVYKVK